MDTAAVTPKGWEFLNEPLFTLGSSTITLFGIIVALLILVLAWVISRILRHIIRVGLRRRGMDTVGTTGVATRLTHYLVMIVGGGIALETAGIDLTALFAAGAVFAVAIGFAMQSILQNFVAGVILLLERSIKPGDILDVDGQRVQVQEMGIRTTVARTLDDESLILPNSLLSQSVVKNLTLREPLNRVRAKVGVSYSSDMKQVGEVLHRVASDFADRDMSREPVILLTGFGDSSVDWEVSIWTSRPWLYRRTLSSLNIAIWNALADAGIVIAFPQVDVHFDSNDEARVDTVANA